jgi:TfoX/Sxy family transcriptional regulator of competence genes
MFAFLNKEGLLGIRLSDEDRQIFIKKYKTQLCEAHGTVLKEYAAVPESLFEDTRQLMPWFKSSLKYVKALKPKPSSKR